MSDVESELVRRRAARQEVVLATVVRVDREPPSRAGEKILLDRQGAVAGTLGCSEFDAAAKADAATVLDSGRPGMRTYQHDLGTIEVYLEPYPELLDLAARVGFHATTTVADAGPGSFAVHTDHDDPGLADALEKVIRAGPRFVGVMGSRRHTGHHLAELRRRGLPEAAVAAIQSPVGLDIGARSAPEIALSILAGLLAIRSGAPGGWKSS
jgi:xanthine/CO dehydrogenase XdhC/CoxF family maturation factor